MPSREIIEPKNKVCEIGAAAVAFPRWERLAPRYVHCHRISIYLLGVPTTNTYRSQKYRDCSQYSCNKEQRDNNRSAFWVCLEDMVDLLQLSIPQRLLVLWCWCARIKVQLHAEYVAAEWLRGTE